VPLIGSELLIIDESNGLPIGLAGVKGGAFAGVDKDTTEIIIEAAHFDPIVTRKTARRLGIVIDASKRFENNPSSDLIPHALREVVALITQIAGGTCEGSIDFNPHAATVTSVGVDPKRVNALLGLNLSAAEIKAFIERVGAQVEDVDGKFLVTAPFWRHDLSIEEDYIDEVGRLYGYEHVVSVVPEAVPLSELNVRHFYSEKIRGLLIAQGFYEVITSSFSKKDEVHLRNALATDKSYMRSTLRVNLTDVLDKNANLVDLLGSVDTRVFEIGTVFNIGEGDQIVEHTSLCIGVRVKVSDYTVKDDALITSVIEALEQELGVSMHFEVKEGIAECDLTEVLKTLQKPATYEKTGVSEEIVYKPFSIYPAVSRDIAFWVPEGITTDAALALVNDHAGALRVRTTLVDVFSKEGRASYAFRVVFQAEDRTLTDEEVNGEMERVYAAVRAQGFEPR
jgi:phenylalanyl-tRNA synthetase beta chain